MSHVHTDNVRHDSDRERRRGRPTWVMTANAVDDDRSLNAPATSEAAETEAAAAQQLLVAVKIAVPVSAGGGGRAEVIGDLRSKYVYDSVGFRDSNIRSYH